MALFHILMEMRSSMPMKLGIAHVDHGWRRESREEAAYLAQLVERAGLPFHLLELDPAQFSGNLENFCRQQRLSFFKHLSETHHYQAVLLGHHGDDQAETVLKRVFEGGRLCGMRQVSSYRGLSLWRPLISCTKDSLSKWLLERQIAAFQDCTNDNPRFLRGRFRKRVLPYLAEEFGREVTGALCLLAEQSQEMEELGDLLCAPYLQQIKQLPTGTLLDLSRETIAHPWIAKHLIRSICEKEGIQLSREQYALGAQMLMGKWANKQIETKTHVIFFDRGRIFIDSHCLLQMAQALPLVVGHTFPYAKWKVSVCATHMDEAASPADWRAVCEGHLTVCLPIGNYRLAPPRPNAPYPRTSSLSKWWNKHKIPAFIRDKVPVVWEGERIVWEFLTGKRDFPSRNGLVVTLQIKRGCKISGE